MIERHDFNADELPDELRGAVDVLRESKAPSAEWRDGVLRATASPAKASPVRGRSWIAVAAAIGGLLVGGTSTYLVMKQDQPAVVADAALPASSGDVRVKFTYQAPGASTVTIVGDFNRWDPTAIPMRRSADGRTWEIEIPLTPGRYAYAFYVDGSLMRDPDAPQVRDNDFGTANSVVMVRGS